MTGGPVVKILRKLLDAQSELIASFLQSAVRHKPGRQQRRPRSAASRWSKMLVRDAFIDLFPRNGAFRADFAFFALQANWIDRAIACDDVDPVLPLTGPTIAHQKWITPR